MYTYFRDAASARYLAPKLQKHLWLEVQTLKGGGTEHADKSSPDKVKCSRCGRTDIHKDGKDKCTLPTEFSDGEAKDLVKNLSHKLALKAVKFAKTLLNEHSEKSHSEIITEARATAKET